MMEREEKLYSIAFEQVKEIYENGGLIYNKETSTERHLMFTNKSLDYKPFVLIDKLFLLPIQIKAIEDCIQLYRIA